MAWTEKDNRRLERYIQKTPLHKLVQDPGPLADICTAKCWEMVLVRVWTEGTGKDAEKFLKRTQTYITKKCKRSPIGLADSFTRMTEDEMVEATGRAATIVSKDWAKRGGKVDKKGYYHRPTK